MYNVFQKYSNKQGNQAIIEVGFVPTLLSQTLSTAITRTLLSSIESYAPVYFMLNSLPNYFNSDFKEKFIEIRSNIEMIKVMAEEEFALSYNGEVVGQLLAKDLTVLNTTTPINFINPNQVILTTNSYTPMNVNLFIKFEKGIYFRTTEEYEYMKDIRNIHSYLENRNVRIAQNELQKTIIPCNSAFSPILKVLPKIVQSDTDNYDNIIFEIQTDGRVTALDALKSAISILNDGIKMLFTESTKVVSLPNTEEPIPFKDNSDNPFHRGDSYRVSQRKINTLEDLNLATPQQYNFIKSNYENLNELEQDLKLNGLSNVEKLFKTNNVRYSKVELISKFENLGIEIVPIKEE